MTFPFRQRRFTHAAGTPAARYVWSPVYVDAMIANGTLDERLYTTYDANYNVTALVNTSGTVVERYMYDPYGKQTVLDPNWSADADDTTDYAFHHGFQGGRLDPATGKIDFRNRQYDPETQRWLQQDPAGYVDGLNNYLSFGENPAVYGDAFGLSKATAALNFYKKLQKLYKRLGRSGFQQIHHILHQATFLNQQEFLEGLGF